MSDAPSFAKFVPGFDFLQGLVKNAGAALPNIGQWVAPTLNPEELEKRIGELRTVQFWLEQNARMLGATIQALEVQRMTLSTLKTMNVQMEDLRDSLQIRLPEAAAPAPVASRAAKTAPSSPPAGMSDAPTEASADAEPAKPVGTGAVDPMQWWGALTKQFTELATNAMKDPALDAARNQAGNAMKQSFDAASAALQQPVAPARAAQRTKSAPSRKRAPAKR